MGRDRLILRLLARIAANRSSHLHFQRVQVQPILRYQRACTARLRVPVRARSSALFEEPRSHANSLATCRARAWEASLGGQRSPGPGGEVLPPVTTTLSQGVVTLHGATVCAALSGTPASCGLAHGLFGPLRLTAASLARHSVGAR